MINKKTFSKVEKDIYCQKGFHKIELQSHKNSKFQTCKKVYIQSICSTSSSQKIVKSTC